MLKIGEFSKMSKVTIKALRYYEKEGLLIPKHIDNFNGYRYHESNQLIDISKIISLLELREFFNCLKTFFSMAIFNS